MATFPTGVSVVTTGRAGEGVWGLTCSSVASVSVEPPTLLVCLRRGSKTLDPLLRIGTFAVNLLHGGGRPAAELFASSAADRFGRVEWELDPSFGGPHLVADAHSIADCRVARTLQVGDHTVVFGEVYRVTQDAAEEAGPLLYGMRRFGEF
ncbi:flavin reductase family protein [Streptomyces sp. NPDC021093]|uniref:flavin reductase family protein n=1 Tax=Streptomyces sp. NPDC021093 TaxID=3365112 RepID=UPI0037882F86